jgi:2-haloacid dehalogenase
VAPGAFIFDAYGTLFDVHSIVASEPALSQLWRRKQLEYTWRRALMNRYEDFWHVTEAALRAAVRDLSIEANEGRLEQLMHAYLSPTAFPEVKSALEALHGSPLAILSNGTPAMVESAVHHNGLEAYFSAIISVDEVETYKPSPRVYALGPSMLNLPAEEILFVSSNLWDAAGAKAFGYRVCWCNRSGAQSEDLGFAPDFVVRSLDQIRGLR